MSSVVEIMQALAGQIETTLCGTVPIIPQLQVTWSREPTPTPPAVDIFPPQDRGLYDEIAFGNVTSLFLIVRARVDMADNEAGQELLLSMMDPAATSSVAAAITGDTTLNDTVETLHVSPPSNYGGFNDLGGEGPTLLGCTWQVEVIP